MVVYAVDISSTPNKLYDYSTYKTTPTILGYVENDEAVLY